MREVRGGQTLEGAGKENERILRHMNAGDAIRHQAGRNDAIAGLGIGWISEYREEKYDSEPATATAFLLDSLKHPAEIESMKQIYRDRFIPISVHSPTNARLKALAGKKSLRPTARLRKPITFSIWQRA
jgi:hypothetical protein